MKNRWLYALLAVLALVPCLVCVIPAASAATGTPDDIEGYVYSMDVRIPNMWFSASLPIPDDANPWAVSAPVTVTVSTSTRTATLSILGWSSTATGVLVGTTAELKSYMNTVGGIGFHSASVLDGDILNSYMTSVCGAMYSLYPAGVGVTVLTDVKTSYLYSGNYVVGVIIDFYNESILYSSIKLQLSGLYGSSSGGLPQVDLLTEAEQSQVDKVIAERVAAQKAQLEAYYKNLYDNKVAASKEEWKAAGYQEAEDLLGTPYTFASLFNSVFEAPLRFIYSLLNFDFLGINLFDFLTSVLTLIIVFAIIKLLGGIFL